jgi:hypothetical protein
MPRHLPVVSDPDSLADTLDSASMPRHRADCLAGGRNAARPCKWLTCRANLLAEGSPTESCALDVIGRLLGNISRERARQLQDKALRKLERRARSRSSLAGYHDLGTLPDEPQHSVRVPGRR